MIRIIAAVSSNGVIGVAGKLPFDYPEDMKHFRKSTHKSVVIMGRTTYLGINKPLSNRTNCVISSRPIDIPGIEVFPSIDAAIDKYDQPIPAVGCSCVSRMAQNECSHIPEPAPPIWLIGGASIYQEGMRYAQELHLTLTPDYITGSDVVRFPWVNSQHFRVRSIEDLVPGDSTLKLAIYERY